MKTHREDSLQANSRVRRRAWRGVQVCLGVAVLLALYACATTEENAPRVTRADLEVFRRTFEGTLVNKLIEENEREVPVMGLPFWTRVKRGIYLQLTVMNKDGVTRRFYDYSEDEERMRELQMYYRELAKGDVIVVDLGYVDEGEAEELFETIRKKMP
ncbi:MAG: hypothetical protein N2595_07570 [bacterium]|nr:hypothetical protein [bacterium]